MSSWMLCVQAGVKHLVWSGCEDPRKDVLGVLPEVSTGRVIPAFEAKGEISVGPLLTLSPPIPGR